MDWREFIGLAATTVIVLALYQKDSMKLRKLNLVGSILMVIYGLLIGALSVWILNGICGLVNLVRIYQGERNYALGAVIVGYQGVGKSTLSSKSYEFIDLESSSFFVDGVRSNDWYIPYCNIALALANQGYIVFVSSHKVVRDQLKKTAWNADVCVYTVSPDAELRDGWIDKLRERYISTKSEKDWKAYRNAEDRYYDNIEEIRDSSFVNICIHSMDYDLESLIRSEVQK